VKCNVPKEIETKIQHRITKIMYLRGEVQFHKFKQKWNIKTERNTKMQHVMYDKRSNKYFLDIFHKYEKSRRYEIVNLVIISGHYLLHTAQLFLRS